MLYDVSGWAALWFSIGFISLLLGNLYFASTETPLSGWLIGTLLGPITTVILTLAILEE